VIPTERRMASKYEAKPNLDDKNTSHALIAEAVGHDKRVLDVGCAAGDFAEVLAGRGCAVTGIELDPEAARQAERHCERVIVGDVEHPDTVNELDEGSFDVVVFGDVLEHLKDPLTALKRLKPSLKPEGYAVASIPNVAHGSVRLALLQGRFRYRTLGLLDETHLRFFTRQSVERLFGDAGFLITDLKRTSRGIFGTEVEVDRDAVPEETLRLVQEDPESLTYQFVLTAHRFGEAGRSAETIRLLTDQLAGRDRLIYELRRKLRDFDDLQRLLEARTEELAEKQREASRLAREAADSNDRLARFVQFGKEQP
jgi:2-polyprenyl-3-methyl-5-hydroxy-6-metoxy-1,4-benzoquinol methylase